MITIDVMVLDYENMSSVNDSLSNPISIDLLSGWWYLVVVGVVVGVLTFDYRCSGICTVLSQSVID
jgi:hypothetical protein